MSDELPQGWASATLGEIAELVSGAGFPTDYQNRKGLPLPFFKVGNLGEVGSAQPLVHSEHTVSPETAWELRARVIPPHSVVFAKIGMAIALNRRRLLGKPACIDNNMMAAIPNEAVVLGYLHRFLETLDFMPLSQATTVPSLRKGDLEKLAVPLPPLAEQQRIVAKLEKLLGKVDSCQKRLAKMPSLLKRFRQSVLAAACSGRLTEDWREKNPNAQDASVLLQEVKEQRLARHGAECQEAIKRGQQVPKLEWSEGNPDFSEYDLLDLPDTWQWSHVSKFGFVKGGKRLPKGETLVEENTGHPYLRIKQLSWLSR